MNQDLLTNPTLTNVPAIAGYKVLDPCVLVAKLGEGGMGEVYRARHLNLNIDCAVKCLKLDMRGEAEFVTRFRREAELAAGIDAANLTRVHDVRDAFGLHYIVMEFVDGESADARVRRKGALPIAEACAIALEASRGLAAAHAAGVIHRDIKPGNILIGKSGVVKLTDLGLAKSQDAQVSLMTQPASILGTPQYMAPEQFEGAAHVTFASDVYAMGATLAYLLAGRHAISGSSLNEIMKQVCVTGFPDPARLRDDLPAPVARVIRKATALEPTQRYADAAGLVAALEECLRELGGSPPLVDPQAGSERRERDPEPPSKVNLDSIRKALRSGVFPPGNSSDAPTMAAGSSAALTMTVAAGASAVAPASASATPAPIIPTAPSSSVPTAPRNRSVALAIAGLVALLAIGGGVWWFGGGGRLNSPTSQPAPSGGNSVAPVTSAPAHTESPAATRPARPGQRPHVPPKGNAERPTSQHNEEPTAEEDDEPIAGRNLHDMAKRGAWREAFAQLRRMNERRRIPPERAARFADELIEQFALHAPEDLSTAASERLELARHDMEPILRTAARAGSPYAALVLAEAHCWYDADDKLKIEGDRDEWITWTREAAAGSRKPDTPATLAMSVILLGDALSGEKKDAAALEHFRTAPASVSGEVLARFAEMYLRKHTSLTEVSPVPSEWKGDPAAWGFEMAQKSADTGCARGLTILGDYLAFGIGGSKNEDLANEFYVKSAKLGHPRAIKTCEERKLTYR